MRQRASTEYSMVLDSGEALELPFEIDEDTARWTESKDGLTGYLGAMAHDDSPEDPLDTGCEGELVMFDTNVIHSAPRPELADFKRLIRENPGRIVTVGLFEHGDRIYKYAAGPFTVIDTKNDKTARTSTAERALNHADGYYIAPDDVIDPAKYAAAVLDNYTNWANGEVFGAFCWRYTRPTTDDEWTFDECSRDSECWGYIGSEYAESERDDRIAEAIAADQPDTERAV